MIALKRFTGVLGGEEVSFEKGKKLTKAQVEELGLAGKPDLAGKEADAEPPKA